MPTAGARAFGLGLFRLIVLAALLGACDEGAPVPSGACEDAVYGDPAQPMQIVVGQAKYVFAPNSDPGVPTIVSSVFQPLVDGDTIDLRVPPQGGSVAWIGARVTNLARSCTVTLRGSLFDLVSGNQVQYEQRPVNLIAAPDAPGWAEPDPARFDQFTNIPLCPDYLDKDIVGVSYRLQMKVKTADGIEAVSSVNVVPTCADENPTALAYCKCACLANYSLAMCAQSGN